MNQNLVSPCPNCGFDASKHNKVLYEGIFLICHNCSYGWYYNVEIFKPNKAIYFENKSTPIKTLNTNIGYNNSNSPNRKYTRHSQSNHNKPSVNKKYNSNKIKNSTISNRINQSPQNKSTNSYNEKKIYYEYNTPNNSNYTKKYTPTINNTTPKISKPSFIDNNKHTVSENTNKIPNSSLKDNITNTSEVKKSTVSNGTKSLRPPINNYDSNTPITIGIPKKINNIYNNTYNTKGKTNKDLKILENNKTTTVPSNDILIKPNQPKNNGENKNNYISNKNSATQSKSNIISSSTINNKPSEKINLPKKENINNTPQFINNKTAEKELSEVILTPLVNLDKDYSITEKNSPKTNLKNTFNDFEAFNINQSTTELNNALKNKTNMGLESVNLLKFEERSNYNLDHFKKPSLSIKQIVNIITDFTKSIIDNIFKIPQLILILLTRLDLLLKTFACLFLLTGTIGFLTYSYHKKQNNIKNTDIQNNEYTNENIIKDNKNLIFENNNVSGLNKLDPTNNVINNNSSFKENLNIVDEKPEDKITAFEKNSNTQSNTQKTSPKNSKYNNLDNINNERSSFLTNIKSTINNSLLSIKKIQINTFNKVKIYNNGFSLQGDYNNTLVTNVTITNSDTKNSYLIRSLEVVFLDKYSKNIGKRIIIANQLINANSGLSINLKINNPPQSTNKLFICIKDKKQL